jgi:hypothetical protein
MNLFMAATTAALELFSLTELWVVVDRLIMKTA